MDTIQRLLKSASKLYNAGLPHHDACRTLVLTAHSKLHYGANYGFYGNFTARPPVPYSVFSVAGTVSRPIRPDIYIDEPDAFLTAYDTFTQALPRVGANWSDKEVILANQVVYSAVISVACCYDLWQRGSRKTPGTFFEILMASLLQQMMPTAIFSKHIPLGGLVHDTDVIEGVVEEEAAEQDDGEDGEASVSTDLVIGSISRPGGIVVPLKITTRERIVQPFAHQRILDSAFGSGLYNSLLVCISETQLDDKTRSVKQVCVPGTVKLFQKYLAPLGGLYYCDLPQRYVAPDMQRVIPVRSVGHLFIDVAALFEAHSANSS